MSKGKLEEIFQYEEKDKQTQEDTGKKIYNTEPLDIRILIE